MTDYRWARMARHCAEIVTTGTGTVNGIAAMALVFLFVGIFLARNPIREGAHDHH